MTRTGNRVLCLICMAFALLCLVVWIPLDTETGLIEQVRRRVQIGDALAPTAAAVFILLGGLVLMIAPDADHRPQAVSLRFGAAMLGLLVAGFVLMLVAGPLVAVLVGLWADETVEYRMLRGTVPWKYVGFALGGLVSIGGIICLAERRVTWAAFGIAGATVLAMIAIFDLPFDTLLLPPNGDF